MTITTRTLLRSVFAAFVFLLATPAIAQTTVKPVHAIAMHGTAKYAPDFKHLDYVNPNAPRGGLMRLGAMGGFDNFNGFIVKGEAADGLGRLYDSLTTSSADEAFTRYGLVAQTMEMPDDRSWIIFNLRPEARFHDGKAITADDVIWTFNTLIKKGAPQFRFYYAGVAKVEALSPRRVKFTFRKDTKNRELPLIVGEMAILPKHYWKDRDFSKTTLEPPLGSGPYEIETFTAGRSITYKRRNDYWAKDLPIKRGRHNFERIRHDYYRDATVWVEAFKGGELDLRNENISKIWATGYNIPAVETGLIKKEGIKHQRTSAIQGYVYNLRRDLFKDRRVRAALAYAFDFEWSNRSLFYSLYTRTRSYFDNSELSARGLPKDEELALLNKYKDKLPPEVFTTEYKPPATKGDGRIRSNLRVADRLLKEAGWVIKGKDRVHKETGQKLSFELLLVSPAFERVSLPFAKNLERLGITMRVRTVDTAQYIRRMETFDFDMVTMIWGQSLSPGNEQLSFWGSRSAKTPGGRNYIGIEDPVVDDLINAVIAAPDRKALVNRTRALDRVLQWGHYLIPHFYSDIDRLIYWNKYQRPKVTPTQGAQLDTWWYDPAQAQATEKAKKALREK